MVAWGKQGSFRERTASDAAPEKELSKFGSIMAKLNAKAGKRKTKDQESQPLDVTDGTDLEGGHPEMLELKRSTEQGGNDGRKLLQSWLNPPSADKRQGSPLKKMSGHENQRGSLVRDLKEEFEMIETDDGDVKMMQILENLESTISTTSITPQIKAETQKAGAKLYQDTSKGASTNFVKSGINEASGQAGSDRLDQSVAQFAIQQRSPVAEVAQHNASQMQRDNDPPRDSSTAPSTRPSSKVTLTKQQIEAKRLAALRRKHQRSQETANSTLIKGPVSHNTSSLKSDMLKPQEPPATAKLDASSQPVSVQNAFSATIKPSTAIGIKNKDEDVEYCAIGQKTSNDIKSLAHTPAQEFIAQTPMQTESQRSCLLSVGETPTRTLQQSPTQVITPFIAPTPPPKFERNTRRKLMLSETPGTTPMESDAKFAKPFKGREDTTTKSLENTVNLGDENKDDDNDDDDLFDDLIFQAAEQAELQANHSQPAENGKDIVEALGSLPRVLPNYSASSFRNVDSFVRFKITEVRSRDDCIVCDLSSRPGNIPGCVELRELWSKAVPQAGDYANIIWTTDPSPNWSGEPIIIDNENHFFVLCPDLLVSPTRVAGATQCVRRAVLAEHIQSFGATVYTVLGNLKHEVIERAFLPYSVNLQDSQPDFSVRYLEQVIQEVLSLPHFVEQIFAVELTREKAYAELKVLIPALQQFHAKFLVGENNIIDMRRGRSARLKINSVVGAEDMILSPLWGLKGMPDMLVDATVSNLIQAGSSGIGPAISGLFSLELKTGSAQLLTHDAQVLLYSLLIMDRYLGLPVAGQGELSFSGGLLMNITRARRDNSEQFAALRSVDRQHGSIAQLLAWRNTFAVSFAPSFFRGSTSSPWDTNKAEETAPVKEANASIAGPKDLEPPAIESVDKNEGGSADRRRENELACLPPPLPPVLMNANGICDNCFEKKACMLFHKGVESGTQENSGFSAQTYKSLTGHLSEDDTAYFKAWNEMIDLEANTSMGYQREIWTLSGPAREAKGRCVAHMKLVSSHLEKASLTKQTFMTIFERDQSIKRVPLNELHIEIGDYVTLSIEGAHHALARGTIVHVFENTVKISTRTPIRVPRLASTTLSEVRWRLDKDEMYNGMRIVKSNLVTVMDESQTKLRELVIRLKSPSFSDDEEAISALKGKVAKPPPVGWLRDSLELPSCIWNGRYKISDIRNYPKVAGMYKLEQRLKDRNEPIPLRTAEQRRLVEIYSTLNANQRQTVSAVLAAQDYVCVHGMPGTGKTWTTAFIVQALRALGCSVLVCAYTHTALDNLLLKLKECQVEFYRIGPQETAHPEVRSNLLSEKATSTEEWQKIADTPNLVLGATCLKATRHPMVLRRKFDYCIVDEAGQLTQPVCLGPLCYADKYVLVGDVNQLPPLVKSETAKEKGMDTSLLSRLSSVHPHSVVKLTFQFRMSQDIMDLANHLIYKGLLKPGSPSVAAQRVQYSTYPCSAIQHNDPSTQDQWLVDVLHPEKVVTFLDTDNVCLGGARERRSMCTEIPQPISSLPVVADGESPVPKSKYASVQTPIRGEAALCSQSQTQTSPTAKGGSSKARHRGKLENHVEAEIVEILVNGLLACGLKTTDIGVISPYRSQLRILEKRLDAQMASGLEVQTVDRYQGRDKDVIIISLVRSNLSRDIGGLLRDWRRINVAFTRAKCKLLVVGSQETLEESQVFSAFLSLVRDKSWLKALPIRAHSLFEHLSKDSETGNNAMNSAKQIRELIPPVEDQGVPVVRNICMEISSECKLRDALAVKKTAAVFF